MTTTSEIWKPIKEFPDYQVSSLGRVKSTKRGKELMMKISSTKTIILSNNGKHVQISVRRLIYSAFHDLELSRLKGICIMGDNLNNIKAFVLKDFLEEIEKKRHPVKYPQFVEERQLRMFDDIRTIIEAWNSGDATILTHRVLSCKSDTIRYIHKITRISNAHAEELWQSVSTTLIIRIMKKEIAVSRFQLILNLSARDIISKSRKQKSRMVQYDDNRLNGENDW